MTQKFIAFGLDLQWITTIPSVQEIFKNFVYERGTIGQKTQLLNEMIKLMDKKPTEFINGFELLVRLSCEFIDSVIRKLLQSQLKRLCKNHEAFKHHVKKILKELLDKHEWDDKTIVIVESILFYPFTVELLERERIERLLNALALQCHTGDEKSLKLCLSLFATYPLDDLVQLGYAAKKQWFMSLFQSCKSILTASSVFWDVPKYSGLLLMALIQPLSLSDRLDCLLTSNTEPYLPIMSILNGSVDSYGPLAIAYYLLSVSIHDHVGSEAHNLLSCVKNTLLRYCSQYQPNINLAACFECLNLLLGQSVCHLWSLKELYGLVDSIIQFWDYPPDCLKYKLMDSLNLLTKIFPSPSEYILFILKTAKSMNWRQKAKMDLTIFCLNALGLERFFQEEPEFMSHLIPLVGIPMTKVSAKCEPFLHHVCKQSVSVDQMIHYVFQPLFFAMKNESLDYMLEIHRIMTSLCQDKPLLLKGLIQHLSEYSDILECQLLLAKLAKQAELEHQIDCSVLVTKGLHHPEPFMRLCALETLVERKKIVRSNPKWEYQALLTFISHNACHPDMKFSEKSLSTLLKFFKSFYQSYYAAKRDEGKKTKNLSIEEYAQFQNDLLCHLKYEIKPNISVPKISFYLGLLDMIFQEETIIEPRMSQDPELCQSLLIMMAENRFDVARDRFKGLLLKMPSPLPGFTHEKRNGCFSIALEMIEHFRPTVAEGGAYLLMVLNQKVCKFIGYPSGMESTIGLLDYLLGRLESKITQLENDMSSIKLTNSIHGLMRAQSMLLNNLSNEELLSFKMDRQLILIQKVFQLVDVIISDASPEGIEEDDLEGQEGHFLLSQSFQATKEAVQWLVTLVELFTKTPSLLPSIESLKDLLMKARHRGAFSAIYEGFKRICQLLKGQILPEKWLHQYLQAVSDLSVSITRRSAGLPYGILGCLEGFGKTERIQMLDFIFQKLIEVAKMEPTDVFTKLDLPQVHAFNILRVLIQDAGLSEWTLPFIGQVTILSIESFSSQCFPIKNCASMIFTACFRRIFGHQGLNDPDHPKLNLKKLISKYPDLWNYVNAVTDIQPASLHPILLILSRIINSDGIKAENLVYQLKKWSQSKFHYIRLLSSRSMVSILPKSEYESAANTCLNDLNTGTLNQQHGVLYQLHCLIEQDKLQPWLTAEFGSKILNHNFLLSLLESTSLQRIVLEIQLYVMVKLNVACPNDTLLQWLTHYVSQKMDYSRLWLDQTDEVVGRAIALLLCKEPLIISLIMSHSRLLLKLGLLSHADSNPTLWHEFLRYNTLESLEPYYRRLFLIALEKHAPSQNEFINHVHQEQSESNGRLELIQLQQSVQSKATLSDEQLLKILNFLFDESDDLRKEICFLVNQYLEQSPVSEQMTMKCLITHLNHNSNTKLASVTLNRLMDTSIASTIQWEQKNNHILYLKEEKNTFKDVYMELNRDVKILQCLWSNLAEKEELRQWCLWSINDFKPSQKRMSAEVLYQVYKLKELCSLVNCLDSLKQKLTELNLVWTLL